MWDEESIDSFETLKKALILPPILAWPDFQRKFILHVDASTYVLGFSLNQKNLKNEEVVIALPMGSFPPRWKELVQFMGGGLQVTEKSFTQIICGTLKL